MYVSIDTFSQFLYRYCSHGCCPPLSLSLILTVYINIYIYILWYIYICIYILFMRVCISIYIYICMCVCVFMFIPQPLARFQAQSFKRLNLLQTICLMLSLLLLPWPLMAWAWGHRRAHSDLTDLALNLGSGWEHHPISPWAPLDASGCIWGLRKPNQTDAFFWWQIGSTFLGVKQTCWILLKNQGVQDALPGDSLLGSPLLEYNIQ